MEDSTGCIYEQLVSNWRSGSQKLAGPWQGLDWTHGIGAGDRRPILMWSMRVLHEHCMEGAWTVQDFFGECMKDFTIIATIRSYHRPKDTCVLKPEIA